jgi:Zn-dependent protease/predicted transcriptional regulator
MFGKRITLFRLLGFEVRVDPSWLVLALLASWTLAVGMFPYYYPGLEKAVYWWMGVIGAAGLFFSILFHEFCHSLVARKFGLPMRGITLFIFGGVAEMDDEPPSPKAEFFMAAAGPISSLALGVLFFALASPMRGSPNTIAVYGVLSYLATINWILAAFNLVPAFPLDGGRLLRAALWHWKKDLQRATRISTWIGMGFGIFLMLYGALDFLRGNIIGGLWMFMIGMFLRSSAESSYQQIVFRKALEGETVAHFMNTRPVTAPSSISIRELVEEYIYRYHFKMFPVMEGEKLLGCITTRRIREIPRGEWDQKIVSDLIDRCSSENSITSETGALQAFLHMNRTKNSRLMVVKNGRLVGIISLKDILGYLALKMELGDK